MPWVCSIPILEEIGTGFRPDVKAFAAGHGIPLVRFKKGDRKIDVMRPRIVALEKTGTAGVAAIGVAREYQSVFASGRSAGSNGISWFSFTKAGRRVSCFYFYLFDAEFGPAFIKICAYFPYPVKVWVNGHEWAKRQCAHAGIGFTALSNGFAACDDPAALQRICDRLGPYDIQAFFDRWMGALPSPLTEHDQPGGYWWELSMRQIETSRTIVFDAPRHARSFFEALLADNLDIGRPEQVELIFDRHIRRGAKRRTQDVFNTTVVTRDTEVTVNAFYRHSRVKQYLKDGRAWRIETVINSPTDLGCHRRIENLDEMQTSARDINRRLLDNQRVGQGCVLASPAFDRVARPSTNADGRKAQALRFGDRRVMALLGALCGSLRAIGFTNRSLRAQVSRLLGAIHPPNQISYDLSRLRLNGLIEHIEHANTYRATADGQRVAIFYTKVHDRLLRPSSLRTRRRHQPTYRAHSPPSTPTTNRNLSATMDIGGRDPLFDNCGHGRYGRRRSG